VKHWVLLFAICVSGASSLFAQRHASARFPTTFQMEEPIASPKKISSAVLRQILRSDDTLLWVDETIAHLRTRINGTFIDLNGDRIKDFLVQGTDGANITGFWIFRNVGGRQRLVLYTRALGIYLLRDRHHGFRDIDVGAATAVTLCRTLYRFNGNHYIPKRCWTENMGDPEGNRSRSYFRCSRENEKLYR
jgi:hypothetical protein